MRQYPVDATRHAQVGLRKMIAGVELQRCGNAALDEQIFHCACVVEYVPHHAIRRLGFLFAERQVDGAGRGGHGVLSCIVDKAWEP